jgi:TPR repeat protein
MRIISVVGAIWLGLATSIGAAEPLPIQTTPELAALALPELQRRADAGEARAQVELGFRYGTGAGVPQDFGKAFAYVSKAAQAGDRDGAYLVGTAYAAGAGVEKNEAEAVRWFERAADKGHVLGQYWMAQMIYTGRGGISASASGAFPYFWKAALQEHGDAQFWVGYAYHWGNGVDQNLRAAAYWYRRAGAQGHTQAQYNLRLLIEEGKVQWQEGDPGDPPAPRPTQTTEAR